MNCLMQKSNRLAVFIFILAVSSQAQAELNSEWFVPDDRFAKTIAVAKDISAEIKTPQGELQVTINGDTQKFFKVETLFEGKMFVDAMDYNFDGYVDLNIFYAYGYMGVNQYTKLYLFDAKTKKFNFAFEGSNLELQPKTQSIQGYEKAGAGGLGSRYKVENGVLYLYESAYWVGECLHEIQRHSVQGGVISTTLADPCGADESRQPVRRRVKSEKVFLHTSPNDADLTKAYLIKGDVVTVLKADKNQEWYFVEFAGQKTIRNWLKADAVELLPDV